MSRPAQSRRTGGGPAGAPVETTYRGAVARDYLARRADSLKWRLEDRAVDELLAALPAGSSILDVPAGTGRFLAAYARHGHRFVGVDVSLDMLSQARAEQRTGGRVGVLARGLVGALPLADDSVDHVLCTRLLNWFDGPGLRQALAELERVARGALLLEIRLSRPLGWRRLSRLAGDLLRRPAGSLRRLSKSLLPPRPGRPVLRIHSEADFLRLIADLGLRVERRLTIADGTDCTRRWFRHTPLAIFVLSRGHDAAPTDS